MHIAFIVDKGGSGSDRYFERLQYALLRYHQISSKIFFIPQGLEQLPFLIPLYLKLKKYDLQKFSLIHTNDKIGRYCKFHDKPLVITVHHSQFDKEFQKVTSFSQKIYHYLIIKPNLYASLLAASKVIAVSNYTKKSIQEYFHYNGIQVIYNGIETDRFTPSKNNAISNNTTTRLLFVGNNSIRKGFDLLPKIMKELGPHYTLFYTTGLREKTIKHVPENMQSLGHISLQELINEYHKCDILIFPTRLEGFGYSVAEAMSCGKPIITTDCSSLPELVQHGKGGFLCKINDVNDFVNKITKLSRDKNLMKYMGNYNRKRVQKLFSLKEMSNAYIKCYKSLIE